MLDPIKYGQIKRVSLATPVKSEAEFGQYVVTSLNRRGWPDVYQEVKNLRTGHRADIIAVKEDVRWVIELKLSLSLRLIEQAVSWKKYAHFVSIAVPKWKRNNVTLDICKHFGVGLLYGCDLHEVLPPQKHDSPVLAATPLYDKQKEFANAGNNVNGAYTPYKATMEQVLAYIQMNPGCRLKDIVDHVQTHYRTLATAKSCISKSVREGFGDYSRITVQNSKYYLREEGACNVEG